MMDDAEGRGGEAIIPRFGHCSSEWRCLKHTTHKGNSALLMPLSCYGCLSVDRLVHKAKQALLVAREKKEGEEGEEKQWSRVLVHPPTLLPYRSLVYVWVCEGSKRHNC